VDNESLLPPELNKWPKSIKYIMGNEACERYRETLPSLFRLPPLPFAICGGGVQKQGFRSMDSRPSWPSTCTDTCCSLRTPPPWHTHTFPFLSSLSSRSLLADGSLTATFRSSMCSSLAPTRAPSSVVTSPIRSSVTLPYSQSYSQSRSQFLIGSPHLQASSERFCTSRSCTWRAASSCRSPPSPAPPATLHTGGALPSASLSVPLLFPSFFFLFFLLSCCSLYYYSFSIY
jgi:hypothetical protein